MTASRAEVRDHCADTLEASALITSFPAAVHNARGAPIQPREDAAIIVSTPRERFEERSAGQPIFRQIVEVHVEVHTTGDSDTAAMEAADELEQRCRRALLGNMAWRGVYEKILRIETASAVANEGSAWRAVAVLMLDLQRSYEFEAEDSLDDLERWYVDTDLQNPDPDGEIEVTQHIEVPT